MVSITAEACRGAIRMGMPESASNIILVGRVLATLFSVATIAVTALLGAALFTRRAGLMAGAIVTFSPVLVAHSRYLKEDAFLTLFIMASLLGAIWWTTAESSTRRRWALVLCAAGAGLAAATKFVGFFIPPLMLWYQFTRKCSRKELAGFALIACGAFALGAIMLVTNLQYIGHEVSFALLRGANSDGDNSPLPVYRRPDWGIFFLTHGVNWGLGWPLTVFAIWGIARGIRSRRAQPAAWLLAAATLLWYFSTEMTTLKRAPDTERYILPCIPMMAVLAGGVLMSLRWKHWPAVGAVLVCALGAESAAMTHSIRTDTRDLAARWLFEQTKGQPITFAFPYSSGNYLINRALLP
jgi:4-amino-4-deoxy-L-arabinose transferase-like glycosyltransferase